MTQVCGIHGLKDHGSRVPLAQQHLTTSFQSWRLPYSEQRYDPSTNKGAIVTKEGEGEGCLKGEQKYTESEKEETALQEAKDKQHGGKKKPTQ